MTLSNQDTKFDIIMCGCSFAIQDMVIQKCSAETCIIIYSNDDSLFGVYFKIPPKPGIII
jgi:hypothetical protein